MFYPGILERRSFETLNDFARQAYNLRFSCDGCGRAVEASAIDIIEEIAQRHAPQLIDRLEERAKCRECGLKGAAITACEINF